MFCGFSVQTGLEGDKKSEERGGMIRVWVRIGLRVRVRVRVGRQGCYYWHISEKRGRNGGVRCALCTSSGQAPVIELCSPSAPSRLLVVGQTRTDKSPFPRHITRTRRKEMRNERVKICTIVPVTRRYQVTGQESLSSFSDATQH
uniref:Uncharacterized protein n=1 Tax=Setaria digitata TaxID=48799 RepID=A0A915Q5A6_9BILA